MSISLLKVFRPDGVNGFDVYTEEEARAEQRRNKPKKVSARVRYGQGVTLNGFLYCLV